MSAVAHTYTSDIRILDYILLLKPRVMSLVVFTGLCGMLVAPGAADMHPFLMLIAITALAFNAGAAGAINMWFDRDIDAIMTRTATRPIPSGAVDASEALGFGVFVSLFSTLIMALAAGWVAAGILAFANVFYSVIYTMWLKRSTPQNIVIGGAAGAFPPLIGWAAVTGDISLMPILLFAVIFFWTPPHFWALALLANEDYKRAGVPMMPSVKGERRTKIEMLVYSVIVTIVSILPWTFGFTGWIYGMSAAIFGTVFIGYALRVLTSADKRHPKAMFAYSIFYLFMVFTSLLADHFIL